MTDWSHTAAAEAALMVFPLLMIIAGAGDVMTLRISNRLVICLAALFPVFAWATGMSLLLFCIHLATAAVLLMAGFGLFSLRLFGGGDAKLLAAAGVWLGFPCALPFLMLTAIAGGLLALAIGALYSFQMEAGLRGSRLEGLISSFTPDVPYGFAIAAGAILTTPLSWWTVAAGG